MNIFIFLGGFRLSGDAWAGHLSCLGSRPCFWAGIRHDSAYFFAWGVQKYLANTKFFHLHIFLNFYPQQIQQCSGKNCPIDPFMRLAYFTTYEAS